MFKICVKTPNKDCDTYSETYFRWSVGFRGDEQEAYLVLDIITQYMRDAGSSGVGKSAVMQHTLQQQVKADAILPTTCTFSAQTTTTATQQLIEAKLERRHRNR